MRAGALRLAPTWPEERLRWSGSGTSARGSPGGSPRTGAEVVVSDIDDRKRKLAVELGARWVDPADAMQIECDVLAPCALGRRGKRGERQAVALRDRVRERQQPARRPIASTRTLAERGILYAPDFIVNAGGLIHVYKEIRGYSEEHARELALGIEQTMSDVLETAEERSITPLRAAGELARERLDAAREPVAAA